jgi:hypothetical protein
LPYDEIHLRAGVTLEEDALKRSTRHVVPVTDLLLGAVVFGEQSLLKASRNLPAEFLVAKPHAEDVALLSQGVVEGIARMLDGQIVDKLDVTALECHGDAVLESSKVNHVESLNLLLGHLGDIGRVLGVRRACNGAAREEHGWTLAFEVIEKPTSAPERRLTSWRELVEYPILFGQSVKNIWTGGGDLVVNSGARGKARLASLGSTFLDVHGQDVANVVVEWL